MTRRPVLLLGARSDMARAIAHRFARAGHPIQLAARTPEDLAPDRDDLALRYGVEVSLHGFDALDTRSFAKVIDSLPALPHIAICAVGHMGEQSESEQDTAAAGLVLRSNFEGPALMLGELANRFAARGAGTLVGISSVAGLRGRATNYVYGSAKAGFTAYLSGLRNRLAEEGVHVLTVLPGFVATRMTEEMDLPDKLTARPEEVAEAVFHAVRRGKDVIYVRRVWWLVMLIIRAIPERVFKRMKI